MGTTTWEVSLTGNILHSVDVPLEEIQRIHMHMKVSMHLFDFFHIGNFEVDNHIFWWLIGDAVFLWILLWLIFRLPCHLQELVLHNQVKQGDFWDLFTSYLVLSNIASVLSIYLVMISRCSIWWWVQLVQKTLVMQYSICSNFYLLREFIASYSVLSWTF